MDIAFGLAALSFTLLVLAVAYAYDGKNLRASLLAPIIGGLLLIRERLATPWTGEQLLAGPHDVVEVRPGIWKIFDKEIDHPYYNDAVLIAFQEHWDVKVSGPVFVSIAREGSVLSVERGGVVTEIALRVKRLS